MCNRYGNRGFGMRHDHYGKHFGDPRTYRVPVNIVKNDSHYELYVFAPDRRKEDFSIKLKGHELTIGYDLKENAAQTTNWIRHEFSKASFERTFMIDETIDSENIKAEYNNGILVLSLPIVPGSEKPAQEINIS